MVGIPIASREGKTRHNSNTEIEYVVRGWAAPSTKKGRKTIWSGIRNDCHHKGDSKARLKRARVTISVLHASQLERGVI